MIVLSQAEVDALPIGADIYVIWSGSIVPHRYRVRVGPDFCVAVIEEDCGESGRDETIAGQLVNVGDWPKTTVFLIEPGEPELWCVHVQGPCTWIPQPDKLTAIRRADQWNVMFERMTAEAEERHPETKELFPKMQAIVWPWGARGAERHAKQLARHGGYPEDIC